MSKLFLHIGLHKTATKYFQHKVFPFLDKDNFIYNPPFLTQLISDLYKSDHDDIDMVRDHITNEMNILAKENKTIIISREIMSGDIFSFYKDFDQKINRLYSAINVAEIIVWISL